MQTKEYLAINVATSLMCSGIAPSILTPAPPSTSLYCTLLELTITMNQTPTTDNSSAITLDKDSINNTSTTSPLDKDLTTAPASNKDMHNLALTTSSQQPTQQKTAGEGDTVDKTGKVLGKGCYNYSVTQKEFLQNLISEFNSHSKRQREAFNAIYAERLVNNPLFALPSSMTAEDWKKSLLKWFDNNTKKDVKPQKKDSKPQMNDAKPHQNDAKPQKNQKSVPSSSLPSATNTSATLSWAKLRDLAKFFTGLTLAGMDVKSGIEVFAASQGMEEEEIS
ncbi:hypothetical protein BT96DRAFT_941458 [Gymnopus androsaceus JB14]|uniref:Uncharacterized protein n=1 Tax=Gymnopus androsaceus JB14 TaxID=1447944 RepID=A0A6A4HI17_9AGAR|nr:hypothetical protein BT96DRAFT_941458 [Gymnopus androsaceus JB14]